MDKVQEQHYISEWLYIVLQNHTYTPIHTEKNEVISNCICFFCSTFVYFRFAIIASVRGKMKVLKIC